MSYRLNSFYRVRPASLSPSHASVSRRTAASESESDWADRARQEGNHPFIQAMVDFLVESGRRANRLGLVKPMMRGANAKYEQDIRTMARLAEESACFVSRVSRADVN